MRHIVSVSLGSSKRDKVLETEILGTPVRIERRGTDGDKRRFQQLLQELDGKVDAIGLGGCDLHLWAQGRRYTFRDVQKLVSVVQHTPVVDGSGLKNTLERWAVERIEQKGLLDWSSQNVLLVSALDRFGMAEALAEKAGSVVFGDALFALGLPLPIRDIRTLARLARVVLPVVVRLPFEWLYPTGEAQEKRTPKTKHQAEKAKLESRQPAETTPPGAGEPGLLESQEPIGEAPLEEKEQEIKKTHNLDFLNKQIVKFITLDLNVETLRLLDKLYVESRYPGNWGTLPDGKPSLEDAKDFYNIAQNIFSQIESYLSQDQ